MFKKRFCLKRTFFYKRKKCRQRATSHQVKRPSGFPGEFYRPFKNHTIPRLCTFLQNVERAEPPNCFYDVTVTLLLKSDKDRKKAWKLTSYVKIPNKILIVATESNARPTRVYYWKAKCSILEHLLIQFTTLIHLKKKITYFHKY